MRFCYTSAMRKKAPKQSKTKSPRLVTRIIMVLKIYFGIGIFIFDNVKEGRQHTVFFCVIRRSSDLM